MTPGAPTRYNLPMPKRIAKPPVSVIVGPAHSAKTARVIGEFRDALARGEEAALILPTFEAASSLRTSLLLDGTFDFLGGPRVLTFIQFAEQVLQRHAPEVQPIDAMVEDELLSRIIEGLAAEGAITHHAGVLDFRGFVRSVRQFITELKRAEIAPETLANNAARRDAPAKDRELSAVYSRYHEMLQRLDLYDDEGRFWRAKLLVSEGRPGPFAALKHVFLDGFYDFTPTQLGLLEALGRRGVALTMTLPLEEDAARKELFETAEATLETLAGRFAVSVQALEGKEAAEPALGWLAEHLFRATVPAGAPEPDSIRLIETPGATAEVREIAREVKRLHLDEGVPLERIAVIFRTLGEYRDLVEEVFEEFGIPARIGQGVRLSLTPVGQLFLQLLRVPAGDWSRIDVMGLLKSNYVSPEAVGLGAGGLPLARFEDLVVEAGVIGGRRNWTRNLKALRERAGSRLETADTELDDEAPRPVTSDELRATISDVESALDACEKLFALFAPIEAARTVADVVRALLGVAAALRLDENLRRAPRDVVIRDLESLASVRDALDGLVRTAAIAAKPEGTARDVARNLALAFADLAVARHGANFGRVQVRDVHDVRALSFDVVFIGGLLERSFPRVHREGPFYDDREREAMSRAGVALEPRRLTQREERFLFYLAVTRAKRRLYLSYPVTDREGKEKLVSYYVEEVKRLFRPHELAARRVTLSTKAVDLAQAGSRTELRRAGVLRLSESRLREPALIGRVAAYLWRTEGESALVLKRGLEGEAERDSWEFFGAHDGVLAHPSALADLAARFGATRDFSVTSLEQYGACPFAFFCRYVLDVEAAAEPPEQLEAVDEGVILHRALREFYAERRRSRSDTRLREDERDAATTRLLAIADRHLDHFRRENPDASDGLFRLHREAVRETLAAFVALEIGAAAGDKLAMTPAHFEAAFGLPTNPRAADPVSTPKRLVISVDTGAPASIVGKIDRIDVGAPLEGSAARSFRVVDYKRGAAPSARGIEEGTSLQMPVYVMAARDVLLAGSGLEPVEAAYVELRRAKYRAGMSRRSAVRGGPDWDASLRLAMGFIAKYVIDIRGGLFPVVRRGSASCPGYCEYRDICRYGEFRARKKTGEYQPWFIRGKDDAAQPPPAGQKDAQARAPVPHQKRGARRGRT